MFVTPPSARWADGRGHAMGRRSDGVMPPDSASSEGSTKIKGLKSKSTMGPMPPKVGPTPHGEPESLQRALEAEMVLFLGERNEHLLEEVEKLKQQVHRGGQAPSSAPPSWKHVEAPDKGVKQDCTMGRETAGHGSGASKGEPPHTPRARSPTLRRTTNGTQAPPGTPPRDLPEIPMPPFPPSTSADSSMFHGYDFVDFRRRLGDAQWLPASMREGKAFAPLDDGERASRLERELAELKQSVTRMQDTRAHGSLLAPANGPAMDMTYGGVVGAPGGEVHGSWGPKSR